MSNPARLPDETPDSRKKETYDFSDLRARYEKRTLLVTAKCELTSELVGGMPAGREGITQFVKNHLGLVDQEAEAAVARILNEELGEKDVAPEEGELKESRVYGINVLRRSEHGVWLKDHMFKACLKAAATRIGLFAGKKGSKGDVAEMGEVRAIGCSLVEADHPERIYLRSKDGKQAAATYFDEKKGRVNSPQGPKSIVTQAECVAPGATFEYSFRCGHLKINKEDVIDMFSIAMTIGLGSAKAFECGKFAISKLEYSTD